MSKFKIKNLLNVFLALFIFYFIQLDIASAVVLEGNFIEGGLVRGKVQPGSIVKLDDQKVSVYSDGTFIIGFHRDSPKEVFLTIDVPNSESITKILKIKQRIYKTQKINGLDEKKVSPPQELLERIKAESRKVYIARLTEIKEPYHKKGFQWPVKGKITGVYGSQRVLNGKPRRPHYGVDVAGNIGDAVVSSSDGEVIFIAKNMYFSGGTLIISHGQGLTSTYLHLNSIDVILGEKVKKGQKVATLGNTGRVTGPHLDWRMEWNKARIDPQLLVED